MKKIPVGILGATGMVGQRFAQLLEDHPWFEVTALAASERSVGKKYRDAAAQTVPEYLAEETILPCTPNLDCKVVFSGLDSSVAGEVETAFAQKGYIVISNSKNHRMDPDVPLLIPEVNPHHLELVQYQEFGGGMIVTNPNCSVVGIAMALKPLVDTWGVKAMQAVTLQAISGAGYPGVASLDILDNVVPFIKGEEDKVETEPQKIFGEVDFGKVNPYPMEISAQCNRVAVTDGHLGCVSVKLGKETTSAEIIVAWNSFLGKPQEYALPLAPMQPIQYHHEPVYPQPKLHRDLDKGMRVAVGRLQRCRLNDWKFVVMSHNTIRGAAGGAILNAELMVKEGLIT